MSIQDKINEIDRLHLAYLPTPIYKLEDISKELGKNIWIKRDDLTGVETSGNKIRKLEYSVAQAIKENASVLITAGGIQSNHVRSTAAVAARLGLKSHLVLSISEVPDLEGNYLLDKMFGAEITLLDEKKAQISLSQKMQEIYDEYESRGIKAYIIPIGASNGIGNFGYINAVKEIITQEEELGVKFDAILCATGSGGTYSGLAIGNKIYGAGAKIIGITVCDNKDYFIKKSREIIEETYAVLDEEIENIDLRFIDGYKGLGYALSKEDELRFLSKVASEEGILLDPVYTGKAFYGLYQEIQKGNFKDNQNILFIHTGGLFGLFPKQKQIAECIE